MIRLVKQVTKEDMVNKYRLGDDGEDVLKKAILLLKDVHILNIHHTKCNQKGFDRVVVIDGVLAVINIDNGRTAQELGYTKVKNRYVNSGEIKEEISKFTKIPAIRIWITCGRVFHDEDYQTLLDASINCIQIPELLTPHNSDFYSQIISSQIQFIVENAVTKDLMLHYNIVQLVDNNSSIVKEYSKDSIIDNNNTRKKIHVVDSSECILPYSSLAFFYQIRVDSKSGDASDIPCFRSLIDISFKDLVDGIVSLGGMDSFLLFDVNFKTVSSHYTPLLFIDGMPHQLTVNKDLTVDETDLILKYVERMKEVAKNLGVSLQAILVYYAHPKRCRKFEALMQKDNSLRKVGHEVVEEESIKTIFQKRQHLKYLSEKYEYKRTVGYCRSNDTIVYYNDFKKYVKKNYPYARLQ